MKHTIFLLDNGKRRKFVVDIDAPALVAYCAIKYLKYSKSNRQNALDLPAGIDVWESDNVVVHPKITPKTNYVKLACDLDDGDIYFLRKQLMERKLNKSLPR